MNSHTRNDDYLTNVLSALQPSENLFDDSRLIASMLVPDEKTTGDNLWFTATASAAMVKRWIDDGGSPLLGRDGQPV